MSETGSGPRETVVRGSATGFAQEVTVGGHRLLADEPARRAMGARARERAAALTWDRCAREALGALQEAAA